MNIETIKAELLKPEYDFLKTDPHLGNKIILLTLGGSYAYGTNTETSDIDFRGCALNSRSDILGLSNFESYNSNETDTVIYSFNKLVNLLLNCNPNVIEILGCKPEHYLYLSDTGKNLIDNRKLFLSQKAVNSFGGYAISQLRRLENALARDKLPQSRVEEHITNSLIRAVESLDDRFDCFKKDNMELFIDKSEKEGFDSEVFCKIHIDKFPVRDFNTVLNTLSGVVGNYDKLGKRSHKKDNAHLNKHAMHLIRLYLMCIDLLEKEEICTYRENDKEFLLSIRNGAFQNEDGTYKPEFFELVSDYENKLEYAKNNTSLPPKPNMNKIEEFVMDVNKKAIKLV